jgi:DNA-directed RNA polymerase specialized sigma24 family protein
VVFGDFMDPEKTNTANNGLEWMLQNTSVDDSSLTAALVSSYYQQIYSLAYHLLDKQPDSAEKAAREAIAAAVRERHCLSIETSLRAWLFAYIYRRGRQANDRPFLKSINLPFFPRSKTGRGFYQEGELEGVPSKYAFALALNDVYDFSLSEAAFVQEISTKAARERLIAARAAAYNHFYPEKLSPVDHLGYIDLLYRGAENIDYAESGEVQDQLTDCPVCQGYAERLPDLARRLTSAADRASQQVPTQDLEAASQALMSQIGLSQKSRRSSLPYKEIGLVGAIVITLLLFGNWLELFTPPDAHPTLTQAAFTPTHTPQANTLSPVFLEGEEGLDYFYFTYPSFQVDTHETLETLSEKTGLAPDDIRYLNGIEPGRDATFRGREIKLAALRDSGWFDPPPRSTQRFLAPPLTASSSVDQVLDRVRESEAYWQTMWGEYMYLFYPFPGYLALPEIGSLFQYWFAGSDLSAFTAAGPGEAEVFTGFQAGSWAFHSDAGGYRGQWQSKRIWGFLPLFGDDLEDSFGRMDFQVGKTGAVAGRETVSLLGEIDDGFGILELWVDALTGVILGFDLNSTGEEIIKVSLRANRIEYDVQLPPGLFYPPTSPLEGLSSGYRADPIDDPGLIPIDWTSIGLPEYIETLKPPPPDLDIARSSILFQNRDLSESSVEIFAGGYYLGSLELPPNLRACQRSPDGMNAILTFIPSALFFSEGMEHYLINLSTLEMMKIAEVQEYQGVRFAFSPDNTRLANLTCAFPCLLFIVDLETGESRKIGRDYTYSNALNLAWSPDGGQIAFMFSDNPSYGQVFVLDVETGEEIFSSNYHVLNETILTPGSPTEKWGVPYPPEEINFPCNQPLIP